VGCPACTAPADPRDDRAIVHEHVTVRTQYASPDLITAIAYEGHDPGTDPRWALSGAQHPDEYARWCRHCCGMACLQMILHHRDGTAPDLLPLLRTALKYGAYVEQSDGSVKGLIYAPFADYVTAEFGLTARVQPDLPLGQLVAEIAPVASDERARPWAGRMVIASVHKEIRRPERPAPDHGGHLVLITGHDPAAKTISFHNPSGHTPATRAATLPAPVFDTFYARRGITVTLTH
jgi:hypothetical protein